MNVVFEQAHIRPFYFHQRQERISSCFNHLFTDDKGSIADSSSSSTSSSTVTTLESAVTTAKFQQTLKQAELLFSASTNFTVNHSISSSLTKRLEVSSSYQQTVTNQCYEEPSNSIDYDNTYFHSEETSRIDDILSLTSITSDIMRDVSSVEQENSLQSDNDDTSEAITSMVQPDENDDDDDFGFDQQSNMLASLLIEANNQADKQSQADYDNVNHHEKQDTNVSLNISMMTSSVVNVHCPMTLTGEQLDQHDKNKQQTDDQDDVDENDVHHQIESDQFEAKETTAIMMNNSNSTSLMFQDEYDQDDDEQFQSTRAFDHGEHDGFYSDQSQSSDDLRYSLNPIHPSDLSEDQNNTNSTLRDQVISITRVRCKKRQTWIRSSSSDENQLVDDYLEHTDFHPVNLSNDQNLHCSTSIQPEKSARMMLHQNSLNSNHKKGRQNGETPFYDFIPLKCDHPTAEHMMKTDESTVFQQGKTSNAHDKDASSSSNTSQKTKNFYLIHQQSSLIPVKDILNDKLHSHIEIIRMDEQDCILEIVDGVLTLVPKDTSSASSGQEKSDQRAKNSLDYPSSNHHDSSAREQRSLSASSSISTPPLSEHEHERDRDRDRDEISSSSSSRLSSSNREENAEPFILMRDVPSKSPPPSTATHNDQSVDLLDLFSTPLVPLTNSNVDTNGKDSKNLMDDSLSSVSSYENHRDANVESDEFDRNKVTFDLPRSPSPSKQESKSSSPSISPPEEIPVSTSIENQTRANKSSVSNELVQNTRKSSFTAEDELEQVEPQFVIPKSEPPPQAKPINKARISEFANLLSGSVHLAPPSAAVASASKQSTPKTVVDSVKAAPSPTRSEDQSFSSVPSGNSDREERESFHTVQSNPSGEEGQKKHIDARYNEKLDDRTTIKIKTSNIKALFEQKISDTNKVLSQSNEQLLHLNENRTHHQHKKIPVSYDSLKRHLAPNNNNNNAPIVHRRQSYQDSTTMNKFPDHLAATKDVVIEDKQPEPARPIQQYGATARRNNTETIVRPAADPLISPSARTSESLIAREIRETKEKEEELKRQRKKCGLAIDANALLTVASNDSTKPPTASATEQPVKHSSFLSNLDFFASKANQSSAESTPPVSASPRRSTVNIQNVVYDSFGGASSTSSRQSSSDERKPIGNVVSQELSRLNDNGVPIVRTNSTSNLLHRSSSNQNMHSAVATNNIIQREIEAIRAKEAELRQLGRIQNTSDDHADPRKYHEFVSTIPKSQSANLISTGKIRRDSERSNGPITPTSNGMLKPKPMTNSSSVSSIRGKFPSPNPTAPIVSSAMKSSDYSKLSSADRLELEKREFQEREQELRRQRHSVTNATLSVNVPVNGDSGNVSQDEHDDDQERYFDKIERLKRTENEKAQAPLVRPTKKTDLSQRWEQMMANKNGTNSTSAGGEDD